MNVEIDIRPTEEECCSSRVMQMYDNMKHDCWVITLIKEIAWYQRTTKFSSIEAMYLRRITTLIDITLESELRIHSTIFEII